MARTGANAINDKIAHLESLARLTREESEEGRRELLHEITDMFMATPESYSEQEVAYFGEIMVHIAAGVEAMVRQHLSETVAAVANAPAALVKSLANDEIAIALPILTTSEALAEKDLVEIVNNQSQEHLKAISKRPTVSERVTDALTVKGDDEVLETLADNIGARFSRGGMETITSRAKDNEKLSQSLMKRHDTPDDLTKDIFWRVSWAMREKMLGKDSEFSVDDVDAMLKETEEWFDGQDARSKLNPAQKFIIRKDKLGQLDNDLLIELLREDKVPEFVAGIGRLAKIDPKTASQTVFDPTAERLAVVCRALDMNFDLFAEILMLTNFDGTREHEATDAILGIYEQITPKAAGRALRFFRTRKSGEDRAPA